MLKRVQKPTKKLTPGDDDEIKVKNWYVQSFYDDDDEYYERAQQRGPTGIAFAERWYWLEDDNG